MQMGTCMPLARCLRALRFLSVFRGWDRILRLLFPPDSQNDAELSFPFAGAGYNGSSANFIDWSAFFYGAYERRWLDYCLARLGNPKSATVLDIGGNIGHHALWFAAQGCKVHTFEPSEVLWPKIEQKAATPGLPGSITLHRTAMGATNETRAFHLPEGANQGTGSFEHEPYNWGGERVEINISAASKYLQSAGITAADLIKIDVEGFEMDVLDGLRTFLEHARPVLWIEISATTPGRRIDAKKLRGLLSGSYRFFYARSSSPFLTTVTFLETGTIPADDSVDIIAVPD